VSGVSGSGKSTLIDDILYRALARRLYGSRERPGRPERISGIEHLDKVIVIDQSPIGRTPRSNPATYTGVFSPIRDLFSQTAEARMRGFKPGRFSFNVKGGRCEACEGDGIKRIEMHFLPDVYVRCEVCKGKRFNEQTLQVTYKGRSIAEVLAMTVEEALELFGSVPAIAQKLETTQAVGLGYLELGQSATTLSGGERPVARSTSWMSPRPACILRTLKNCSACSTSSWTTATPSWSSSTTLTSSRRRITSLTSVLKAARAVAGLSRRVPPKRSRPPQAPGPGSASVPCCMALAEC
jgi:excinuclease ABC subunit A